jgi:hypothetical protein
LCRCMSNTYHGVNDISSFQVTFRFIYFKVFFLWKRRMWFECCHHTTFQIVEVVTPVVLVNKFHAVTNRLVTSSALIFTVSAVS